MESNKYCIIMAGGVGSRFWPVSRNATPKQFLDILGTGESFLQATVHRFEKIIPAENIIIVSAMQYKDLIKKQVPELLDENILLETRRRNTAPCIAYATYKLYKKHPDACVVVTPSDHLIINEEAFLDTISTVLDHAAVTKELYTLGIKPTRPETQYGYIQTNRAKSKQINGHTAYQVKTFTEKPNADLAKELVKSGEFLWNSGIFVWNLEAIKSELEKYLPDVATQFKEISDMYYTPKEQSAADDAYEASTAISIDYGVMEKTSKSWVFEASFGWSDLGTWESLYVHNEKDSDNNVIVADANMMINTKDSIIVSNENRKLVVVKGLQNYMVISTKDVLLVCPRDEKGFKEIFTDLAVKDLSKYQ